MKRMIALMEKNLLCAWWVLLLVVGGGLLFSLADWPRHWSATARDAALIYVFLVTGISGTVAFGVDLKGESLRFLDYLPLRRSQIWLANFLQGLIILALTLFALGWRWIFVAASDESAEATLLLSSPGGFVLAAGSVGFFCLGFGLFSRVLAQDDSPAVTEMIFLLLGVFISLVVLFYMGLSPGVDELAPVLISSGCILTASSFWIFTLFPPYFGGKRRHLAVGLMVVMAPTALLFHGYHVCLGLAELAADEELRVYQVVLAEDPPGHLLAVVGSQRSGSHTLAIDVASERVTDLGRLEPLSWNMGFYNEDRAQGLVLSGLFLSWFMDNGLWKPPLWSRQRLAAVDLASLTPEVIPEVVNDHFRSIGRTVDGQHLLVTQRVMGQPPLLHILDRRGLPCGLPEIRLGGSGARLFASPDGLLLAPDYEAPGVTPDHPAFLILDLSTGRVERFRLPGRLLGFSPRLTRAVCVRERVSAGGFLQSVVNYDVASKQETILLAEDELPLIQLSEKELGQGRPESEPRKRPRPFVDVFDNPPAPPGQPDLHFDSAFSRALWHSQRVVGEYHEHRLVLLDLDSGEKRLLLGPDLLPRSHVTQSEPGFDTPAVYGFLPDGSGAVVLIGRVISIVDCKTGELVPITEPLQAGSGRSFSPDRRRLWVEGDRGIDVHAGGRSRTIYRGFSQGASWFDDDWITVVENHRILLVAADGSQTRVLLDVSRGACRDIRKLHPSGE